MGDRNGTMTTTSIIEGILYAINQGADVVNLSLGMKFHPDIQYYPKHIQMGIIANSFKQEEQQWNKIFKYAEANNCTLVLAAGNENILAEIPIIEKGYCHLQR